MRTRVLWVIKGLGPGGAEHLLAVHARRHDTATFHIECAYVRADKDHLAESLEQHGISTLCIGGPSSLRWIPRLIRLVRSGDWDVVHVHSPVAGSVARLATRSLRRGQRPIVLSTEHNSWDSHRRPSRWINRATGRWNDTTFAVTDEVLASISARRRRRSETLRHGIDVDDVAALRSERSSVRREFGLADDAIVLGTVANFRPQKDYPTLLRAVQRLLQSGRPVHLIAVGQGPDHGAAEQLAIELGVETAVIFAGYRADAARVMSSVDVFVLASRWEGLPLAVMEALALGLPIVATAVGGMAEQLVDGRDALLVEPGNPADLARAIEQLLDHPHTARRLAASAAAKAADFDAAPAIERIERSYRHTYSARKPAEVEVASPTTPSPRAATSEIRPATADDRAAVLELCRTALGWGDDPRFAQLFAWKHDRNPFGPSYQWVAVERGEIVGLRAFMRWDFLRGGTLLHAVRAVDTAVRPDFQGRGLFTALTLHGLDEIEQDGVDFVFNTPNDASRPGYIKMGWQTLGRLPVAIRPTSLSALAVLARSRQAASHWPSEGHPIGCAVAGSPQHAADPDAASVRSLQTHATSAFDQWRYGLELLGYRRLQLSNRKLTVRVRDRGNARELVVLDPFRSDDDHDEVQSVLLEAASRAQATHCLVLGAPPAPGWITTTRIGPTLTWRSANMAAMPPLANWQLTMRDVELF